MVTHQMLVNGIDNEWSGETHWAERLISLLYDSKCLTAVFCPVKASVIVMPKSWWKWHLTIQELNLGDSALLYVEQYNTCTVWCCRCAPCGLKCDTGSGITHTHTQCDKMQPGLVPANTFIITNQERAKQAHGKLEKSVLNGHRHD